MSIAKGCRQFIDGNTETLTVFFLKNDRIALAGDEADAQLHKTSIYAGHTDVLQFYCLNFSLLFDCPTLEEINY